MLPLSTPRRTTMIRKSAPSRSSASGGRPTPDGHGAGVVLEAVHNRDGSIGRWTFLVDGEYLDSIRQLTDGKHYMIPMQVDKPSRDGSISRVYGSRELHAVTRRTAPDLLADIEGFVTTGVDGGDGPADGRDNARMDALLTIVRDFNDR